MAINYQKAPFPWFGGKSKAAPTIWKALGDVSHYVEPFCGSLATLLLRPHVANRPYYSETVNDADGLLINFWRSLQLSPDETAEAASWPMAEADLHARHLALVRWKESQPLERLMANPKFHDSEMAGWWAWGQSSWIGSGWCSGTGPWTERDGLFIKQGRGEPRETGVARQLPRLGNDGQGVNHAGTREVGLSHPGWTMPETRRWFAYLSARLRHVRIANGDWTRVTTRAAVKIGEIGRVKGGKLTPGRAGVLLDPPYGDVRCDGLYAQDDLQVASKVRQWCLDNGSDPTLRIVLAGFTGEGHEVLVEHGWTEVEWFKGSYLTGGMANVSATRKASEAQKAERLWLSPNCLPLKDPGDISEESAEEPWTL